MATLVSGTSLSRAEDHAIEFTKEFISKTIAANLAIQLHSVNLKAKDNNLVITIKYDKSIYEEILVSNITDTKYNSLFVQGHYVNTEPIYAWARNCGFTVSNGFIKVSYQKILLGESIDEIARKIKRV